MVLTKDGPGSVGAAVGKCRISIFAPWQRSNPLEIRPLLFLSQSIMLTSARGTRSRSPPAYRWRRQKLNLKTAIRQPSIPGGLMPRGDKRGGRKLRPLLCLEVWQPSDQSRFPSGVNVKCRECFQLLGSSMGSAIVDPLAPQDTRSQCRKLSP